MRVLPMKVLLWAFQTMTPEDDAPAIVLRLLRKMPVYPALRAMQEYKPFIAFNAPIGSEKAVEEAIGQYIDEVIATMDTTTLAP
jgi:hypothetical protein